MGGKGNGLESEMRICTHRRDIRIGFNSCIWKNSTMFRAIREHRGILLISFLIRNIWTIEEYSFFFFLYSKLTITRKGMVNFLKRTKLHLFSKIRRVE